MDLRLAIPIALLAMLPAALLAESASSSTTALDIGYTGAPTEHGGRDCSTCHNSFATNSDSSGSVSLNVTSYNPGVMQTIRVTVKHPTATRWGFQMTARTVSDQTKNAGTFTPGGQNVQVVCDDGSEFGSPAPCSATGQIEFPEHTNAPRTPKGMGFEFDVTWMPPSPEIGKVTFYVSAVAADGDDTPLNDRVYTISQTVDFTGSCPITKKPTVRTAENGASFQSDFSSNALISVFGAGFTDSGTKRSAALGDFVNGAFPTVLTCIAVEVTGPGVNSVRLPITYVQQDQINAQAPRFTGVGPVMLRVIINPDKPNQIISDVATLNSLQNFAPAFFVFGNTQSIAATFTNGALLVDPSVIPGGMAASPGDIVTLYGTGFGDTNPLVAAGTPASVVSRLTNPITVTIGGITLKSSDVLYAGLSPGLISGLYQFNVRVPSSVSSGAVPVVITIGGQQTQVGATIPIQ